jgi:hypothetical protein
MTSTRNDLLDLALVEFAGGLRVEAEWFAVFVLLLTLLGEPSE